MPQCPICKAAVWLGHQYCSTCGNPLPPPEGVDYSCPQCGLPLATPQETCQKCNPPLTEITGVPIMVPPRTWGSRFKIIGLIMGAGLIVVGLLMVFPFKKIIRPPQMTMAPASQAVSGQTHTAAPIPASRTAPSAPMAPAVQEIKTPSAPTTSFPGKVTAPNPSLPRYFVNTHELSMRDAPDTSALLISTLNFKDEVELLDTADGWGRVRDVKRNIVGWSYMRYLEPVAADGPQTVPQNQASIPQEPKAIAAKASGDM
jgi:predicted RNA-binding Zn-ribbon protein involved in translation (DUF1610 family)